MRCDRLRRRVHFVENELVGLRRVTRANHIEPFTARLGDGAARIFLLQAHAWMWGGSVRHCCAIYLAVQSTVLAYRNCKKLVDTVILHFKRQYNSNLARELSAGCRHRLGVVIQDMSRIEYPFPEQQVHKRLVFLHRAANNSRRPSVCAATVVDASDKQI